MDDNLLAVFSFVLVVLFAFVLPITIYAIYTDHKKQMSDVTAKGDVRAEALEAELAVVNERIAVLERIVTDRRYDLDEEIRQLDTA